jgi:predicted transcriptional regulator
MSREKRTRALLAELGIKPEHAAVSLKAATEALLAHMPDSKAHALSQDELFAACKIPSRTTGQKALRALLAAGKIERIGKGGRGSRFRYFTTGGK